MISIMQIALDGLCKQAKDFGCSDADIAKARAECERTGSDKPMQELIMPALKKQLGGMFPLI